MKTRPLLAAFTLLLPPSPWTPSCQREQRRRFPVAMVKAKPGPCRGCRRVTTRRCKKDLSHQLTRLPCVRFACAETRRFASACVSREETHIRYALDRDWFSRPLICRRDCMFCRAEGSPVPPFAAGTTSSVAATPAVSGYSALCAVPALLSTRLCAVPVQGHGVSPCTVRFAMFARCSFATQCLQRRVDSQSHVRIPEGSARYSSCPSGVGLAQRATGARRGGRESRGSAGTIIASQDVDACTQSAGLCAQLANLERPLGHDVVETRVSYPRFLGSCSIASCPFSACTF